MTINKIRPVILDVEVRDPVEWYDLLVSYSGFEKGEFLYLVNIQEISIYGEPRNYYKIPIKDIPHYDFNDDRNSMSAAHLPKPVLIDDQLHQGINASARIMMKRYKFH